MKHWTKVARVEIEDIGCKLRPRCLECDLPRCQFDRQPYLRVRDGTEVDRDAALVTRRLQDHLSWQMLAAEFGLNEGKVRRIVATAMRANQLQAGKNG